MGARQSKRSVDITTTPKKGELEVTVEGEGKVEKIGEIDVKATTNGAVHSEIEFADKDETTKEDQEKGDIKENGVSEPEEGKTPEEPIETSKVEGEKGNESVTSVTGENEESKDKAVEETPENKKNKEKSKKKKWSFRSISFSKKDKSKPNKDADKNGEVKEVAEEQSPEEKITSPSVETPKTEEASAPVEASSPATNGNATVEEIAKVAAPVSEAVTKTEEPTPPVAAEVPSTKEEPVKVPEPAESAPSPVKEEPKVVEEPTPKVEESKPVVDTTITTPTKVEETKEVRTEEVPPPLPSSNPPSPVTVFAETTKADNLISVNQVNEESVPLQLATTNLKTEEASELVKDSLSSVVPESSSSDTDSNKIEAAGADVVVQQSLELVNPPSSNTFGIVDDKANLETNSPINEAETKDSSPVTSDLPSPPSCPIEVKQVKNESSTVNSGEEFPPPPSDEVPPPVVEAASVVKDENVGKGLPIPPVELPVALELQNTELPSKDTSSHVIETLSEVAKDSSSVVTFDSDNLASANKDNVTQHLPPLVSENVSNSEVLAKDQPPVPDLPPPPVTEISNSEVLPQNLPAPADVPELPSPIDSNSEISTTDLVPPPETVLPVANNNSFPNPEESIPVSSSLQADSLPDISTESLPSLPEQISESLPEPMSLPPVESLPEPLASVDAAIVPNDNKTTNSLPDSEVVTSLTTNETIVTNGNTNGLPSPVAVNDENPPPIEGSLKQVPPVEITENKCEIPVPAEVTDAIAKAEE